MLLRAVFPVVKCELGEFQCKIWRNLTNSFSECSYIECPRRTYNEDRDGRNDNSGVSLRGACVVHLMGDPHVFALFAS